MAKTKYLTNKIKSTTTPLIRRVVVFLSLCIIYSGLIGPRIISGHILYKDHFGFYGTFGKVALFGTIAFILLVQRSKNKVELKKWGHSSIVWLIISSIYLVLSWLAVSRLLAGDAHLFLIVVCQSLLWLSMITAAFGIFGLTNIGRLAKSYKKELLVAAMLSLLFYVLLISVYAMWRVLATLVLHAVRWLLSRVGIAAVVVPPRSLVLSRFGIEIAQTCSGIESIALFSALYILIGVLDWQKFNHNKFIWVYPIALLVLFGLNIVRVFLLILAGYYINPQIAFSLFHTYAGMVFFILYSVLFWGVSYKWMLLKNLS